MQAKGEYGGVRGAGCVCPHGGGVSMRVESVHCAVPRKPALGSTPHSSLHPQPSLADFFSGDAQTAEPCKLRANMEV
jgi:hypothetical protein